MTIQKITELQHAPVVGKYYLVPCIYDQYHKKWLPVGGSNHNDAEFFPKQPLDHFHYDLRFIDLRHVRSGEAVNEPSRALTFVQTTQNYYLDYDHYPMAQPTIVPLSTRREYNVQERRVKCRREQPEWDSRYYSEALHKAFKGKKLNCGKCPHRGADLSQSRVVNGKVTCHFHGLAFDVATGKCVSRTKGKQS